MKENEYKILVVDDNPKNVEILAILLSENGYDVDYTLNGPDALKLVASKNFDLILLDIMMPEMDGFEVCKRIKKDENKKEIPVIFLTAKTDIESIEKAFQYGGLDYVSKPFNSGELLARVATHVELKVGKDKLKKVNIWLEEKVEERTKELKIANDKVLELDNAKSQFLQIISHEIRTPLNGIIGSLDLLKDEGLSEGSLMLINMLDNSANRLESFSYKALDISMFSANGKNLISLEKTNIKHIISNCITNLEGKLQRKGIEVSQSFRTKSEIVNVDKNYFYKCIFNIVDNAINYSPEKETVSIEVKENDKHLIIEVKDVGIGFGKEFIINDVRLFENKDHLDKNPGLGLFLSNQIVQAHGGTIETGNNNDKGAFVKICLPIDSIKGQSH